MKRFLTILLAALALTGLLCVTASASSFDGPATELAAIGMLKGGANGFDLDKAPTRSQAAIMLVRLFGAEEEAKAAYAAGDLKCPFTDVNETAAPFAAWLADKGLASGTSETTFGGDSPCSAKAYAIFLLRALGYQDNVDFTAANAQEFAMGLGLLDTSAFTGTFLRDDLVAMTYQALGMDLKDGKTYLLKSLIESGAVDAKAAKPMTDKFEAYRALQASGAKAAQGLDADVDVKMSMILSVKGTDGGTAIDTTQRTSAAVWGRIQMVLDKDLQMAMDLSITTTEGNITKTEKIEYWLQDGTIYVRSGGETYKMPADMDMASIAELMEQSAGQKTGAAMLPFIDSITVKSSEEGAVYTLKLNNAFSGMINGLMGQILGMIPQEEGLDMDMSFDLGDSAVTYTVDKDGTLTSAEADMDLKAKVNASDGKDALALSISMNIDMFMEVKAMGKDVKISFPDFSDPEQFIGGADGPTSVFTAA